MKIISFKDLVQVKDVESIYGFDISSGTPFFIGWGELTSSGNFRVVKHPFPVDEQLIKDETPNDAVLNSHGWEETPSYCGITGFNEFLSYVVISRDDVNAILQVSTTEFKELIGLLKDGHYVFVITDEPKTQKAQIERRNA